MATPDNGPSVNESDYCRLVALGGMKAAVQALSDATALLEAVDHPSALNARTALTTATRAQNQLHEEISP